MSKHPPASTFDPQTFTFAYQTAKNNPDFIQLIQQVIRFCKERLTFDQQQLRSFVVSNDLSIILNVLQHYGYIESMGDEMWRVSGAVGVIARKQSIAKGKDLIRNQVVVAAKIEAQNRQQEHKKFLKQQQKVESMLRRRRLLLMKKIDAILLEQKRKRNQALEAAAQPQLAGHNTKQTACSYSFLTQQHLVSALTMLGNGQKDYLAISISDSSQIHESVEDKKILIKYDRNSDCKVVQYQSQQKRLQRILHFNEVHDESREKRPTQNTNGKQEADNQQPSNPAQLREEGRLNNKELKAQQQAEQNAENAENGENENADNEIVSGNVEALQNRNGSNPVIMEEEQEEQESQENEGFGLVQRPNFDIMEEEHQMRMSDYHNPVMNEEYSDSSEEQINALDIHGNEAGRNVRHWDIDGGA